MSKESIAKSFDRLSIFWESGQGKYASLLLLYYLWMCIGIFPLHCYEADSIYTIAGCYKLFGEGFVIPPVYHYEYEMQPLVYYMVAGLSHIFPFLNCEQMYCLLSAISAMIAVPLMVEIIHKISGIRKELALFALFLLPETAAIGMYPNTAVFAYVLFVAAIYLLLKKRLVPAIVLLCIAPLFRVDVIMVYPVILLVFLWQKDSFTTAIKKSAIAAAAVVAALVICLGLLKANPFATTLFSLFEWQNRIPLWQNILAAFTLYTALGFLLLVGSFAVLIKRRQYITALLIIVPILLNHIGYGHSLCATKHLLYMLPFVALGVAIGLDFVLSYTANRKALRYGFYALVAIFLTVSVRIDVPGRPWLNTPTAEGTAGPTLTLVSGNIGFLHVSAGLGAGMTIKTMDERMLASGNLVYPFHIHGLKTTRTEALEKDYEHLKKLDCDYDILYADYEQPIFLTLLADGFRFECLDEDETNDIEYLFEKDGQKVAFIKNHWLKQYPYAAAAEREKLLLCAIDELKKSDKPVFMISCIDSFIYYFDKFAQNGTVTKLSYGMYNL